MTLHGIKKQIHFTISQYLGTIFHRGLHTEICITKDPILLQVKNKDSRERSLSELNTGLNSECHLSDYRMLDCPEGTLRYYITTQRSVGLH